MKETVYIPAFRRLRQVYEFQTSLVYITKPYETQRLTMRCREKVTYLGCVDISRFFFISLQNLVCQTLRKWTGDLACLAYKRLKMTDLTTTTKWGLWLYCKTEKIK